MQSSDIDAQRQELLDALAAKDEELERFVYTVSHDLKSPLVTIQGFLGLLEKDAAAGDLDRMQRDIDRIKAAAENMARLLQDLLRLSRVGRQLGPFEEVPLGQLAREAVTRVAGQIHEREVELELADDLPVVRGDKRQLLEVLHHLIDNAVKFMGDQAAPRIEIGARRDGGQPVLTVRDNGIGIAERHRGQIFGLFERLDKETGGTGIGLALVKRIVDLHGGRVWVESGGEGAGSTFCLALPAGDA